MHLPKRFSPSSFRLAAAGGLALAAISACDGGTVAPADPKCGRDAMIEDSENGDDQIIVWPPALSVLLSLGHRSDYGGLCVSDIEALVVLMQPAGFLLRRRQDKPIL